MNECKKAKIEDLESEIASAVRWLGELDAKIEAREVYLKHSGRKLSIDSPQMYRQYNKELMDWKTEKKEVQELLEETKKKHV